MPSSPEVTSEPTAKAPTSSQVSSSQSATWEHYFRLTRMHLWPLGSDIYWFAAMWALLMSAYRTGLPLRTVGVDSLVFAVACTFCHNAGCIWNDICDSDFDGRVERTKNRPLPSGLISVPAALLWLGVHTFAYLATLTYFGRETVLLGVLFCVAATIYPFAKRFTYWPQAFLGFTGIVKVVLGWYAVNRSLDWSVVAPLCLSILCWIICTDTIYACPDKPYDKQIGVYSTALLFGDHIRPLLSIFAVGFVASLTYAGFVNGQGPMYYASVGIPAVRLLWQMGTTTDFEKDGTKLFKANVTAAYSTVGGLFADYLVKSML